MPQCSVAAHPNSDNNNLTIEQNGTALIEKTIVNRQSLDEKMLVGERATVQLVGSRKSKRILVTNLDTRDCMERNLEKDIHIQPEVTLEEHVPLRTMSESIEFDDNQLCSSIDCANCD